MKSASRNEEYSFIVIPDTIPAQKHDVLASVVKALSSREGVVAVVLGGSYARRTQHTESDLDLGIYYSEASPFSITAIEAVARRLSIQDPVVVTDFYGWGQWVNGGAWIHTASGKVDFLYRNMDQVERTIDEAWAGRYQQDYNQQPTFGFYSVAYLGETHVCVPLYDPHGCIAHLKSKVETYPPALKQAIIANELWSVEFSLLFADKSAASGDIYNTAGCMARIAACLTQVLYALNEMYFISDKGAFNALVQFKLCPSDYANRISRLLACPGHDREQLTDSVTALRGLWLEIVELAGDIYKPKFILN